jgi:transcriptional regulator with GAF, ATPase, and Fis domain
VEGALPRGEERTGRRGDPPSGGSPLAPSGWRRSTPEGGHPTASSGYRLMHRKVVVVSSMDDVATQRLFARMVALADTLVSGFDVVDLADDLVQGCLEFLPVDAAGILLDDQRGTLRVLASSSEATRVLEMFELQSHEGPCFEAFSAGHAVRVPRLTDHRDRWPGFVSEAIDQDVRSAYALPLRLHDRTIGALNLFCRHTEPMTEPELDVGRAMASMATLGILNHWSVRRHEGIAEQLQTALDSRVVIEQAKGVIAERSSVDMGTAFELLRSAARAGRRPLSELAAEVVNGRMSPSSLAQPRGGRDRAR